MFLHNTNSYTTRTLSTLLKDMGADRIDVVRLDVEGAEWEVMGQWQEQKLLKKIDQLLMEVHYMNQKKQVGGFPFSICRIVAVVLRACPRTKNGRMIPQRNVLPGSTYFVGGSSGATATLGDLIPSGATAAARRAIFMPRWATSPAA